MTQATETKIKMPNAPKTSREHKAAVMFKTGVIATRNEDGWLVPGSHGNEYEVRKMPDGTFLCSCPDNLYRGHGGSATDLCKHAQFIRLLQESDKLRAEISAEQLSDKHDIHLHRENRIVIC